MKTWIHIISLLVFLLVPSALVAKMPSDITSKHEHGITYHYLERFEPAVATMSGDLEQEVASLESQLAFTGLAPVSVWVVKRIGDYFAWHDQPNRAPEWAVGLSFSNQRTVLVVNGAGPGGEVVDLVKTFRHELAHVAVDVASGQNRVPRWFHEGFALMHAEEWTAERSDALSRAAAMGTLRPFSELTSSFPPHHQSASVAYAQSYHFIRHLQSRFGDAFLGEVLADMRRGKTFDTAFKHQSGHSLAVVEAGWRGQMESSASPLAILSDEMVIFFGASLLFLVAFGVRRYRTSKKLASMAMDEAGDGWDYDVSRYPLPGDK